jgi:hypothetical protein
MSITIDRKVNINNADYSLPGGTTNNGVTIQRSGDFDNFNVSNAGIYDIVYTATNQAGLQKIISYTVAVKSHEIQIWNRQ